VKKTLSFYKALLDNLYDGVYFLDQDRKILYWNKGAERITGYTAAEVQGSHCWDKVLMHVDRDGVQLCEQLCPAAKTMQDGIAATAEVFLHHKNGHRVPVNVRVSPVYDDANAVVGAVEVFSDNSDKIAVHALIDELHEKAYQDALTELPNRRYLDRYLTARLDELARYGWGFGLIFLDIDHFKNVNDQYGHVVGDETLCMVARTLMHSARSFDVVGRWGGEEFVVAVANVDREKLQVIAERYRVMIQQSGLSLGEGMLHVTISLGATLARYGDSLASLVSRADSLMYQSKQTGRNCVTID
jgi:diguanylate cyclase (GGDEF)-like protein/PAS domain S-box-containing protein